jgi:hypothetical protein
VQMEKLLLNNDIENYASTCGGKGTQTHTHTHTHKHTHTRRDGHTCMQAYDTHTCMHAAAVHCVDDRGTERQKDVCVCVCVCVVCVHLMRQGMQGIGRSGYVVASISIPTHVQPITPSSTSRANNTSNGNRVTLSFGTNRSKPQTPNPKGKSLKAKILG